MTIACPICESTDLLHFLEMKNVPVHQNMIFKSPEAARAIPKGDLDMTACRNCSFVFNAAFDENKTSYDQSYDNTQCHSSHFNAYLNDLVKMLVEENGAKNTTIVEVGCGKGDFIKKLVNYPNANNKGYGFDPTYIGPDIEQGGKIVFEKRFYDESCAAIDAGIVICRHVIEHVAQPRTLIRAVAGGLRNSPHARIFFETPDVSWIFRNQVIWDFFYEHCSLFTPASISYAFEAEGFEMTHVGTVFEGQYLWAESTPAQTKKTPKAAFAGDFIESVTTYKHHYADHLSRLKTTLKNLKAKGPVALWGAGAKGVTVCNIADPDGALIDAIIDVNPNKQGGFIAGTGHTILKPDDISARGIRSALIMNPNYRAEIEALLHSKSIKLDLYNWDD
ncbi:MAG: class I SAM-dependent methyltransferase [Alphaproteobacteria bacterium]|nr:class I SAM-dependent methyltransferase [Alphaproteobacteria bacterium]MCD8566640.1 class I SAM-dependent methyltransferase [Alphaproteobacteria bacterium]